MKNSYGKMKNPYLIKKKLKFFTICLLIIVCILFILYYCFVLSWNTSGSFKKNPIYEPKYDQFDEFRMDNIKENSFNGAKIVHLDLKGAPPKISYYYKLFPLLSQLGATGILIEYEDMFPYKGPLLGNISALNAYTIDDIRTINRLARESNLNVIPLVPTFGHMEFVLKLEHFKDYREVFEYPQSICPTFEKTKALLIDMLNQIIKAHPYSNIIHIGADEVYLLGLCDRCINIMNKFNLSKSMLFLEHVKSITDYLHSNFPNLTILMWDDEFRSFSVRDLKSGKLNSAVQPVVWKYTKDVYDELGPSLWDLYSQVFPKIWVASAFKGATGSNQFICDVTHYVQNHRSWLYILSEYKSRFNFQGIIFTGWQRYDHFAILCELLPVGLPSLAMSLRVIMGFKDSPLSPPNEVAKLLGCKQPYALIGPAFGSPKCSYPGADILENVIKLQQLKHEFETVMDDSKVKGWLTNYNINYEFSNPKHIQTIYVLINRIRGELAQIDKDITIALMEVYDDYTIEEWKQTYLVPFEKQTLQLATDSEKILAKKVWPRRPFEKKIEDEV